MKQTLPNEPARLPGQEKRAVIAPGWTPPAADTPDVKQASTEALVAHTTTRLHEAAKAALR